ncbi:MAG TPA: YIP1 family protein [Chloroflexi bacterium]|nr:YIP1 family protein [Chloroflexota bacterium]
MDTNEGSVSNKRGVLQLLWGMTVRPRNTLQYLNEKGGRLWWLPALLAVLMAVLPIVVGSPIVAEQAREVFLANQEQMAEQGMVFSEEQLAQMENIATSPLINLLFPIVASVLGLVIAWLIWSGLLYLAGMVFGGRSTFGDLFRMTVWAWWPFVWRGLFQTVYILVSGQLILHPGLSGLVSGAPSASEMVTFSPGLGQLALIAFLAQVDLFLFWRLALLAVGVIVVMRLSWRKAALIVLGIWLLLTALGLIPTLIGGMFARMMAGG